MKKNNVYHGKEQVNVYQAVDAGNKRKHADRRKLCSEGYAYISVVGWICRREWSRRKDDSLGCPA